MQNTKNAKKPVDKNSWIIAGVLFLLAFLSITFLTISKVTQGFDASFALSINNMILGSSLNSLMVLASEYGREYFWIPIVALMLLLGKRDTKLLAIELAALFVVGIIAGEVMKHAMFRARPYETVTGIITRVIPDTDSSYPSGHALIVSIGAIFSLIRFRRKSIALLLTMEAAIVCYSRVYVGMHYPLDVLGGICLGGFIVFTGSYVLEKYLKQVVSEVTNLAQKVLRSGLFSL
ncbi:MAG: phosphatase PAP2 family protein [Nitrososphaerales archaeon]